MVRLDYEKLRATPVATDPFRHVVVPEFVPAAELARVFADLPAMSSGVRSRSARCGSDRTRAGLIEELEGPAFRSRGGGEIRPRSRQCADHGDAARLRDASATGSSIATPAPSA